MHDRKSLRATGVRNGVNVGSNRKSEIKKMERETGLSAPSTKPSVEFMYRLG